MALLTIVFLVLIIIMVLEILIFPAEVRKANSVENFMANPNIFFGNSELVTGKRARTFGIRKKLFFDVNVLQPR